MTGNSSRCWLPFLLGGLSILTSVLSGCQNDIRAGGPDLKYLDTKQKPTFVAEADNPLLPLRKGSFWEMTAYCQDPNQSSPVITKDRYAVTGTVKVGDIEAYEVQIQRNGKKWRRELYRRNGNTIELVGTQDEDSELMTYVPPIPLFAYPVKEGNYQNWIGEFSLKGHHLPARALSRVTSTDNLKTPAGIFKTLKIDTMVVVSQGAQEIKFPAVRWMAPGVGFVRRGYADKGRPATAEVTRFEP